MSKKTERIFGSFRLGGNNREEVEASLLAALDSVENEADYLRREILWDTLDIITDREQMDSRTFVGGHCVLEYTDIRMSALSVKLPATNPQEQK